MSFFSSLFGGTPKKPHISAQEAIVARFRACDDVWEQRFGGHSMIAALTLCEALAKQPIPKALPTDLLTTAHYNRLFKILFAYFWMTLLIHDRKGKTSMRRLLTKVTDQNQEHTDNLCDDLELACKPGDSEDVRVAISKVAWRHIQQSMPTDSALEPFVHMAFPIIFDSFRDSVAPMFS